MDRFFWTHMLTAAHTVITGEYDVSWEEVSVYQRALPLEQTESCPDKLTAS